MAEGTEDPVQITKPGVLALGSGLPGGQPTAVLFEDSPVVQISCGVDHSAVVLASGRVYLFGKNQDTGWKQVDPSVVSPPVLVSSLRHKRVVQASCGHQFTMFLTDKGQVYSSGVNDRGQLGLGHTSRCPLPELVTGIPCVKKVAAGCNHALVLTESGKVWGTGRNDLGQIGYYPNENQTRFVCVPGLPDEIIDIACGGQHSALLSSTRTLLMTGSNRYGELGLETKDISNFISVSVLPATIAAVSCGTFYTVALRDDGSVWSWGYNGYGELGTGDRYNRATPTPVIGLIGVTITQVFAKHYHTALLTSDGDVLLMGKGDNGELGKAKTDLSVPTVLKKSPELVVKQVAFAEMYSLLLIEQKAAELAATENQCEVKTELKVDRVHYISDVEKSVIKSLECPVCFEIMNPPIHQCRSGHSVCGTCRSRTPNCAVCRECYTDIRNLSLEHLSAELPLPCVECSERMPANLLDKHGEVCPCRMFDCPLDQTCGWSGRPATMLTHAMTSHPDQTWQDLPRVFAHSTSDEVGVHTDILAVHGQVLTLHRRYDKNSGKFQAFVRYIGPPQNAKLYKLKITIMKDDEYDKIIFLKKVSVDTENIDVLYESASCVTLEKGLVDSYLYSTKLMCEVDVLKVGVGN